jgi:hypothetical protein
VDPVNAGLGDGGPLTFAKLEAAVARLDGAPVMAVVEGLGRESRASAHGPLHLVDLPGALCFAIGDGFVVTLVATDFIAAQTTNIDDGAHFTLQMTFGTTTLTLGDQELLGSDYELGDASSSE